IATKDDFTEGPYIGANAIDQTSSQAGWFHQTEESRTAYDSIRSALYVTQTNLSPDTQYYWRAYAIDLAGSNTWSAASTARSFTTGAGTGNYWVALPIIGDGLWTNDANWSKGVKPVEGEHILFLGDSNTSTDCTFDVYADLSGSLASLTLDGYTKPLILKRADTSGPGSLTITGNITVNSGNIVAQGNTSAINEAAGGTAEVPYGEGIQINAANITVAEGVSINADHQGFLSNTGPGKGIAGSYGASGGGYGGKGGDANAGAVGGSTYGSAEAPTALGSGGGRTGGDGAGALRLVVPGALVLDGVVSAVGYDGLYTGSGGGGGGSGGSLWFNIGTLSGAGQISANGGNGAYNAGGAGGGGRVAISITYGNTFTGSVTTSSGTGYNLGESGVMIMSFAPTPPVLSSPADGATYQMPKPVLKLSSTDADNDYLLYKIVIAEDPGFTTGVQTFDQTSSQAGWSGQNAEGGTSYTSGSTATYTIQEPLNRDYVYYWKAFAKDPAGTGNWSSASATRSFTVGATVSLTSPSGGESWTAGTAHNIAWTAQGPFSSVKLSYSLDAGSNYDHIIADSVLSTPGSGGSYSWTVPENLTSTARVKIEAVEDPLTNSASGNFSIVIPSLTLTSPNGAESFYATESRDITWTSSGAVSDNISLYYSTDSGATYPNLISGSQANDGSYSWVVPYDISSSAKVKIESVFYQALKDSSSAQFGAGEFSGTAVSGAGLAAGVTLQGQETKNTYAAGTNPSGVAFDSATNSIWVTNYNANTVSKFNMTTGEKVDYDTGTNPKGIVFDPVTNSMWVANSGSANVSKINVTTGERTDYNTGIGPFGAAFDPVGNAVWVTNYNAANVSKLDVATGSKTNYPTAGGPQGITFDPVTGSMWVACYNSNKVSKVNINTGARTDYACPGESIGPYAVAFDPVTNSVWATNYNNYTVSKFNVSSGERVDYSAGVR
ncbi:MAG: hypothetical protein WC306_04030, partial [Candidatus Paceibacterota bacterium]